MAERLLDGTAHEDDVPPGYRDVVRRAGRRRLPLPGPLRGGGGAGRVPIDASTRRCPQEELRAQQATRREGSRRHRAGDGGGGNRRRGRDRHPAGLGPGQGAPHRRRGAGRASRPATGPVPSRPPRTPRGPAVPATTRRCRASPGSARPTGRATARRTAAGSTRPRSAGCRTPRAARTRSRRTAGPSRRPRPARPAPRPVTAPASPAPAGRGWRPTGRAAPRPRRCSTG